LVGGGTGAYIMGLNIKGKRRGKGGKMCSRSPSPPQILPLIPPNFIINKVIYYTP